MLNYKLLMDNELIIQNSQLIIKKVGEFIRYKVLQQSITKAMK